MKILKYQKLKDNRYEVILDDGDKVTLYDDIIIRYNLLIKKEVSKNELTLILEENDKLVYYFLAIKYLGKKLRSEKEIIEYLKKKEASDELIKLTVNHLKENHLLDDEQFVKAYINDQLSFTLKGPYKIQKELINLGINEELITQYLDYDNEIFKKHLESFINKKVKANHRLSKNNLLKKLRVDIYNMGYDVGNIDMINIDINDSAIIKKEYDKLLKKYQNKENRDYLIKNALYKKGYNLEDINNILEQ